MVVYNTRTKILIVDVKADADTVSGSPAETINDFIQTLDSTTNAIQWFEVTSVANKLVVTIVYLG